jgi:hypothetical protein
VETIPTGYTKFGRLYYSLSRHTVLYFDVIMREFFNIGRSQTFILGPSGAVSNNNNGIQDITTNNI